VGHQGRECFYGDISSHALSAMPYVPGIAVIT
jgi:hypothetical protein